MEWFLILYLGGLGGDDGGPVAIPMQSEDACKSAMFNALDVKIRADSYCINTQTGQIMVYR